MAEKLTRGDCLRLLKETYARLREMGEERYPKRADFSESEVVAIKAFLGPWPRALEAAGLKPPREKKPQTGQEKRCARDPKDVESHPVHAGPKDL